MSQKFRAAPAFHVQQWLNSEQPLSLETLRGRVVAVHAFQFLCPGCVAHGIPQAQRIHALFDPAEVAVIGLHTVFEHHDAMQPHALAAFLHEYRVHFPVGVDEPDAAGPIPRTMRAYAMKGTPTLILIDRQGRLRRHDFGQIDDLTVGSVIGTLLAEPAE